ncbi:MAG: hypothetical protein HQL42_13840 [Alphaproteobacteria bacterium]|nr:hypothetical protein [Alphaproteobacteria bacterium]
MRKHFLTIFAVLAVAGGSAEARETIPALLETAILTAIPDAGAGAVFQASRSSGSVPVGTRFTAQYQADERNQRITFCIKTFHRPSELSIHAPSGGCLGHVVALDGSLGLPATRKGNALAVDQATQALIALEM